MNKDLISIIVPVYNVERYIGQCVESLLCQTYSEVEILLIDDGSTDGSVALCDKMAKKEQRIKVWHKKNGGLSSARNFGIKKAKGEYICFVDSDDFVKKDFVKELYNAICYADADIAICGYNQEIPSAKAISGEDATVQLLTLQNNINVIAWNKMYKKTLFLEHSLEFPEGDNYEDTLTTYKILSFAKKVIYVDKSLYVYRERKGSITQDGNKEEKLIARERAAKEAMPFFKNNKNLLAAAEFSLLLAKYAFLDFAIKGDIDKKYINSTRKWLKNNCSKYRHNKYMTLKTKAYYLMSTKANGILYRWFRTVIHE